MGTLTVTFRDDPDRTLLFERVPRHRFDEHCRDKKKRRPMLIIEGDHTETPDAVTYLDADRVKAIDQMVWAPDRKGRSDA